MLYEGSDGNVHVLGDGEELKHYKYIKKIKQGSGWRYFYTPEEVQAYLKEGKKKVDSIPRLQKHGDKYYIADKKTQKKIEKSGAGGNYVYKTNKKFGKYDVYKTSDNQVSRWKAKDAIQNAKGKEADNGRNPDKTLAGKTMSVARAASETSKIKARESAYSKYEAKNVANKKMSEIKNKASKGRTAVEKKLKKKKIVQNGKEHYSSKTIKETVTPMGGTKKKKSKK